MVTKAKKEKGFVKTLKTTPKADRLKRGENQTEYWSRFGVTQSGGSRYEAGRPIPKPTQMLRELADGMNPLANLAALRGTTVEALISKGK